MPLDPSQREQLLRTAVLAGDQQAWQTWYEECYDALYRYVLWRSAWRHDWADEVVQETWLVAVRRIRHFDPRRGLLLDWLRGIAGNVIRNQLRRRVAHESRVRSLDGEPAQPETASVGVETDQAQRIAAALAALPEHYEAVLRLKYVDSASVAEIAAQRDQSPKAVESLLVRARQMFRQKYEKPQNNGEAE